jgi:hypothetical protein
MVTLSRTNRYVTVNGLGMPGSSTSEINKLKTNFLRCILFRGTLIIMADGNARSHARRSSCSNVQPSPGSGSKSLNRRASLTASSQNPGSSSNNLLRRSSLTDVSAEHEISTAYDGQSPKTPTKAYGGSLEIVISLIDLSIFFDVVMLEICQEQNDSTLPKDPNY